MALLSCPICGQQNSQRELRCVSCGADFHDPDVRELMDDPSVFQGDALLAGAETLSASKVLGFRAESLDDGPGVTALALLAAGLAGVGFMIPVADDFSTYSLPWAIQDAPIAAWFPLVLVIAGIALAVGKRLPVRVRGAALAVIGLAGLLLAPGLGEFAALGSKGLPVMTIGLVLAGAACVERLYDPHSMNARYALIAGAVLAVAGLLIPASPGMEITPAEMRFYHEPETGSVVPLTFLWERTARAHMTFFIGIFSVLPFALAPAAAAVAWVKPGVWDHTGLALRPLAWLLILYFPLAMALFAFNFMGWDPARVYYDGIVVDGKAFTQAAMAGRSKLMLLDTAYALSACFGLVAAYRTFKTRSA